MSHISDPLTQPFDSHAVGFEFCLDGAAVLNVVTSILYPLLGIPAPPASLSADEWHSGRTEPRNLSCSEVPEQTKRLEVLSAHARFRAR